jgi:hypothetical protein
MTRVDEIMGGSPETIEEKLRVLKKEVDDSSISTVADKQELEWSITKMMPKFRIPHIIKLFFGFGE